MNKQGAMDAMHYKDRSEQFDTVLHLGAALTVAACAAYPASDANIEHLL